MYSTVRTDSQERLHYEAPKNELSFPVFKPQITKI